MGRALALPHRHVPQQALRLRAHPARYYTGVTANLRERLMAHNAGHCPHTRTGRPWKAIVVVAFAREDRAIEFERYLKSGSGVAFAMRHFR
jgi:putative endonuclease